ncbi:hypothetical protein HpDR96b_05930 [Helicobacter pylori]
MQEISAYELIKQKLHAIPNQRHKGSLFEKISKQFYKSMTALTNTSLLIFGMIGN